MEALKSKDTGLRNVTKLPARKDYLFYAFGKAGTIK